MKKLKPTRGRPPGKHGTKVAESLRISEAVKAFLRANGGASLWVENRVRKSKDFREWNNNAK